jgi:hypothetical protein
MTIAEHWMPLGGTWTATNAQRMMPDEQYTSGPAEIDVRSGPGPGALSIRYRWEREGAAHDGLLVVTAHPETSEATAVWLDTFHQAPDWMELSGRHEGSGRVTLVGSYAGDWGWRISLDPTDGPPEIVMDNVPPGGEPYPVVHLIADPR